MEDLENHVPADADEFKGKWLSEETFDRHFIKIKQEETTWRSKATGTP